MECFDLQFSQLSLLSKTLIIIGTVTVLVFFGLLVSILYLSYGSKYENTRKNVDIGDYSDFLKEFAGDTIVETEDEGKEAEFGREVGKLLDLSQGIDKSLLEIVII